MYGANFRVDTIKAKPLMRTETMSTIKTRMEENQNGQSKKSVREK